MASNFVYHLATELANSSTLQASKLHALPTKITDRLAQTRVDGVNFDLKASGTLPRKANDFRQALDPSRMLVKSIHTGELKTVNLNGAVALTVPTSISAYEVRDDRVAPKQNYSKIDPGMVNIFAHKGPDEPKSGDDGIGGGAL